MKQFSKIITDFYEKGLSEDCPIIDFHAHMGNFSGAYMSVGTPQDMLSQMDRCNVVKIHFCSHHALTIPEKAESYDLKIAREYSDRLRAFYSVISRFLSPREDLEIVEKNREIVASFKFYCEWYGVPIYDSIHAPYFEYADCNKLLVLSHTWGENELDGVRAVSRVLEKYSNLTFIAGHSFYGDWDGAINILRDYPNLYLELTAVLA